MLEEKTEETIKLKLYNPPQGVYDEFDRHIHELRYVKGKLRSDPGFLLQALLSRDGLTMDQVNIMNAMYSEAQSALLFAKQSSLPTESHRITMQILGSEEGYYWSMEVLGMFDEHPYFHLLYQGCIDTVVKKVMGYSSDDLKRMTSRTYARDKDYATKMVHQSGSRRLYNIWVKRTYRK